MAPYTKDEEEVTFEVRMATDTAMGQLTPQAWMEAPETQRLIDVFRDEGEEIRFAGGCVRDALANREVTDIDMATPLTPDKVTTLLERAGIKVIPTGVDHGSVTAVVDGAAFEITTLRRDEETDGRRARVKFTSSWVEDARRRDFTFNALSADRLGAVYDPFNGIADLAHGKVRFVGRADDRVREDYLRILRYFRFYARFGRPPADKDATEACRSNKEGLRRLSGERVWKEMKLILLGPEPADVCIMMRGLGVLKVILPEALGEVTPLRMKAWLTNRAIRVNGVEAEAVRRLAALVIPDPGRQLETPPRERALAIAERWKFSNSERDRLVALLAPEMDVSPDMSGSEKRRALHRLGPETVRDTALLNWAMELAVTPRLPRARTEAFIALLDSCHAWTDVQLPISGQDVLDQGIKAGPAVGEILLRVESWWEAADYQPSREDCLAEMKRLLSR